MDKESLFGLVEAYSNSLCVELLKAKHIALLNSKNETAQRASLQKMLWESWLAQAEKHFAELMPARNRLCVVATEEKHLIAYLTVRPYNRRGTCWLVESPTMITPPKNSSLRKLNHALLTNVLELGIERAHSWVIRCPSENLELIGLARELGFQPLKLFQCWTPSIDQRDKVSTDHLKKLPKGLVWQGLTKTNAPLLWHLELSSSPSHLRQIVDRQWTDLLSDRTENGYIILAESESKKAAIAGIINRGTDGAQSILELLRDQAWDNRLVEALPIVLKKLKIQNPQIQIETSHEDEKLNELLSNLGWERIGERILLARSLWKRQLNNKIIYGTRPLESMLERLQPQHPPLPTPSLGRR